jgi:hypothetical protein
LEKLRESCMEDGWTSDIHCNNISFLNYFTDFDYTCIISVGNTENFNQICPFTFADPDVRLQAFCPSPMFSFNLNMSDNSKNYAIQIY